VIGKSCQKTQGNFGISRNISLGDSIENMVATDKTYIDICILYVLSAQLLFGQIYMTVTLGYASAV